LLPKAGRHQLQAWAVRVNSERIVRISLSKLPFLFDGYGYYLPALFNQYAIEIWVILVSCFIIQFNIGPFHFYYNSKAIAG
jgi:hypothetical protein